MALLSTVTINDTISWAKQFGFNREQAIGNSLEPALSTANIVAQTILGPPFSWWWNNEDLVFTCNPTLATASLTNVVVAANIATFTANNTFNAGQEVIFGTITGTASTFLNGQILEVLSASGTQFTARVSVTTYGTAGNTGTITAATTQDYVVPGSEFSHIDWAAVQDINSTPAKWMELTVQDRLSLDSTQGRPAFINAQSQDDSGNVTFRVMPAPNRAYPVALNIMKTAPRIISLNQTWAPLPDFMQYIYNWGFLTLSWAFADDPRVGWANGKFTSAILARQGGLTDTERNIFLNNWNDLTAGQQQARGQSMQARSV